MLEHHDRARERRDTDAAILAARQSDHVLVKLSERRWALYEVSAGAERRDGEEWVGTLTAYPVDRDGNMLDKPQPLGITEARTAYRRLRQPRELAAPSPTLGR